MSARNVYYPIAIRGEYEKEIREDMSIKLHVPRKDSPVRIEHRLHVKKLSSKLAAKGRLVCAKSSIDLHPMPERPLSSL